MIGSVSFMLFLLLLVYSLTVFVDQDLSNALIWGGVCLVTSIIMFVIFFFWEKRTENPIIDLRMFRNRRFAFGIFTAILAFQSLNVIFYQLPFYLRDIRGMDVIDIGLVIIGSPLAMAIVGPFSGRLSDRIDPKYIASIGMVGISVDLILLAVFLTETTPYWFIVVMAVILGISLGAFLSPNSNSIMSAAPKEKLGIASSLMNLSIQIGFSIGTALSTALLLGIRNVLHVISGVPAKDPVNYMPALKIMFGIFAAFSIVAVFISYLRGSERREITDK